MPRALVTGGTGVLGGALVPRLAQRGYTVRILSRREVTPDRQAQAEWAQARLATGEGVAEAVEGVPSSPPKG